MNHYLKDEALERIPVWRMIATPRDAIARRARRWARAVGSSAQVVDGRSMVGGGSLPDEGLPTKLLALPETPDRSAETLARSLRAHERPVVGRIERDTLLLDPRTVHPREDRAVIEALQAALGNAT